MYSNEKLPIRIEVNFYNGPWPIILDKSKTSWLKIGTFEILSINNNKRLSFFFILDYFLFCILPDDVPFDTIQLQRGSAVSLFLALPFLCNRSSVEAQPFIRVWREDVGNSKMWKLLILTCLLSSSVVSIICSGLFNIIYRNDFCLVTALSRWTSLIGADRIRTKSSSSEESQ